MIKSGIVINDGIFLNPMHIVKMNKYDLRDNAGYWIEIFLSNGKETTLSFKTVGDRDVAFKKIISDLYGEDCCTFEYRKGEYIC